jgi:hypothetical protein
VPTFLSVLYSYQWFFQLIFLNALQEELTLMQKLQKVCAIYEENAFATETCSKLSMVSFYVGFK